MCLKCTASYSTPAHLCFCLLGCENRWSLPNTPPGYWALCTLLSYDSAPFLSCGKFPSGVRQGPVIACHLSGPCPRGPCGAGGLLDLPLVPLAWPRAACAASAGRAGGSCFFLILSPSPHFLATFGKGAIGRARSERRSTFVSKLMHEHLATEARQEMWAGRTAGSVTCGCGCVLSWAAPTEVSRLQWHMLECSLAGESAIRARWHTAVRLALSKWITLDYGSNAVT